MSDPRVLDGNAVGGLLHDVFGAEVTAVPCTCGSCGARGEHICRHQVAAAHAYWLQQPRTE